MKALVLVGGFGTRLRPITYAIPKQLIPLAGKPMLYHVLDLLPKDVEEVVLASGYKADVLEAFLQAHPLRWPTRCVPEAEPLGTGGGMKNVAEGMSDPFILMNSDVVAQVPVEEVLALHRLRGGVGIMTLAEVADTRPYGVAALGAEDRIERFVEKPAPEVAPSHWINAGLSVWRGSVLDRIPAGRQVSWEQEIVPGLLAEGVYGFRMSGFWEDAGTPARLLRAQRLLFDAGRGGPGALPKGALGKGPVFADAGVEAHGASFGPYVHLGARVHVSKGALVENSILMEGVQVGDDASVAGSVIGPGVSVPAAARIVDQVLGADAKS
ncbi:MAG TPA: NDP-sugar synthase [Thermoplasmata archaeon]|nr:NDP-sugar synthase [Thermoplasmata archaeon]